MDESIKYNLRNPAFTDDIGYSMINRMYPSSVNPMSGTIDNQLGDVKLNNGQPEQDSFQKTKRDSDKEIFKKLLLGGAAVILAIFGFKKGKSLISKLKGLFSGGNNISGKTITNNVKGFGAKIGAKLKSFWTKIKSATSNPISKVKNAFTNAKNFVLNNIKKIKK